MATRAILSKKRLLQQQIYTYPWMLFTVRFVVLDKYYIPSLPSSSLLWKRKEINYKCLWHVLTLTPQRKNNPKHSQAVLDTCIFLLKRRLCNCTGWVVNNTMRNRLSPRSTVGRSFTGLHGRRGLKPLQEPGKRNTGDKRLFGCGVVTSFLILSIFDLHFSRMTAFFPFCSREPCFKMLWLLYGPKQLILS